MYGILAPHTISALENYVQAKLNEHLEILPFLVRVLRQCTQPDLPFEATPSYVLTHHRVHQRLISVAEIR